MLTQIRNLERRMQRRDWRRFAVPNLPPYIAQAARPAPPCWYRLWLMLRQQHADQLKWYSSNVPEPRMGHYQLCGQSAGQ